MPSSGTRSFNAGKKMGKYLFHSERIKYINSLNENFSWQVYVFRKKHPIVKLLLKIRIYWESEQNPGIVIDCFHGMVDQKKAFSLISSQYHRQRSSPW